MNDTINLVISLWVILLIWLVYLDYKVYALKYEIQQLKDRQRPEIYNGKEKKDGV